MKREWLPILDYLSEIVSRQKRTYNYRSEKVGWYLVLLITSIFIKYDTVVNIIIIFAV